MSDKNSNLIHKKIVIKTSLLKPLKSQNIQHYFKLLQPNNAKQQHESIKIKEEPSDDSEILKFDEIQTSNINESVFSEELVIKSEVFDDDYQDNENYTKHIKIEEAETTDDELKVTKIEKSPQKFILLSKNDEEFTTEEEMIQQSTDFDNSRVKTEVTSDNEEKEGLNWTNEAEADESQSYDSDETISVDEELLTEIYPNIKQEKELTIIDKISTDPRIPCTVKLTKMRGPMNFYYDTIYHVCPVCSTVFISHKSFIIHYRFYHSTSENSFSCWKCPETFMQWRMLSQHLQVHVDPRPFVCRFCFYPFRKKENLDMHEKSIHDLRKEQYNCEICGRSCKTQYELKVHKYKHEGKNFIKRAEVEMKAELQMKDSNNFLACIFCNLRFLKNDDLEAHYLGHNSLTKMKCRNCSKDVMVNPQYILANYSMREFANYSMCEFKCIQCVSQKDTATTKSDKYIHGETTKNLMKDSFTDSKIVTNNGNPKTKLIGVKCYVCGIEMSSNIKLFYHLKAHLECKQFKCPVCREDFISREAMIEHCKEKHSQSKKVKCEICKKEFYHVDLTTHMKTHLLPPHLPPQEIAQGTKIIWQSVKSKNSAATKIPGIRNKSSLQKNMNPYDYLVRCEYCMEFVHRQQLMTHKLIHRKSVVNDLVSKIKNGNKKDDNVMAENALISNELKKVNPTTSKSPQTINHTNPTSSQTKTIRINSKVSEFLSKNPSQKVVSPKFQLIKSNVSGNSVEQLLKLKTTTISQKSNENSAQRPKFLITSVSHPLKIKLVESIASENSSKTVEHTTLNAESIEESDNNSKDKKLTESINDIDLKNPTIDKSDIKIENHPLKIKLVESISNSNQNNDTKSNQHTMTNPIFRLLNTKTLHKTIATPTRIKTSDLNLKSNQIKSIQLPSTSKIITLPDSLRDNDKKSLLTVVKGKDSKRVVQITQINSNQNEKLVVKRKINLSDGGSSEKRLKEC